MKKIMLSNNRIFSEMIETYQDIPTSMDFSFFADHSFSDDITRYYAFLENLNARLINTSYLHSISIYSVKFSYLLTIGDHISEEEEFSRDISGFVDYGGPEYYNRFFLREDADREETFISYIYPSFNQGIRGEILLILNVSVETLRKETEKLSDRYDKDLYLNLDGNTLPLTDQIEDDIIRYENFGVIPDTIGEKWTIERTGWKRFITTWINGGDSGGSYVSRVELDEYTADFQGFLILLFFLFLLFLFITVFLAVYYTRYLYSPIEKLIELFAPDDGPGPSPGRFDEFQLILHKYKGVIQNYENMKVLVDANELMMRDKFLENLIKGQYDSKESIRTGLERFGIVLSERCCLILCYIENRKEAIRNDWHSWLEFKNHIQASAESLLSFHNSFSGLTCELSGEEIVLLLSFPEDQAQDYHEERLNLLQAFLERCPSRGNMSLHLGVGKFTENVFELEESYFQASRALRRGLLPDNSRIHFYNLNPSHRAAGNESGAFLNLFIGLAKSTEISKGEDLFFQLIEKDRGSTNLNAIGYSYYIRIIFLITEYIREHFGTDASKVIDEYGENPYWAITHCQTAGEVKKMMIRFFDIALWLLRENQNESSSSGRKVMRAVAYIEENSSDKDLCLAKVADKIGINPSYMSRIFSKEMGRPFQDYLADIRLRNAKTVLVDSEIPIYQISESVGFGSVLSFNRLFKKREGCTPKVYREHHA